MLNGVCSKLVVPHSVSVWECAVVMGKMGRIRSCSEEERGAVSVKTISKKWKLRVVLRS